jgi:hypothetical protein
MRITYAEARSLPEYSATNPTGVTPGKRWRRHNGAHDMSFQRAGGVPRWMICTYEEIPGDDKFVRNGQYRPVIRVKMGRAEWRPCEKCGDLLDCASWQTCMGGR